MNPIYRQISPLFSFKKLPSSFIIPQYTQFLSSSEFTNSSPVFCYRTLLSEKHDSFCAETATFVSTYWQCNLLQLNCTKYMLNLEGFLFDNRGGTPMEKKEEFKKAVERMSDEQLVKYLRILKFSLDEDISQFSHLSKYLRNP